MKMVVLMLALAHALGTSGLRVVELDDDSSKLIVDDNSSKSNIVVDNEKKEIVTMGMNDISQFVVLGVNAYTHVLNTLTDNTIKKNKAATDNATQLSNEKNKVWNTYRTNCVSAYKELCNGLSKEEKEKEEGQICVSPKRIMDECADEADKKVVIK